MRPSAAFHFRPIAACYDLLTGQDYWRAAICDMLDGVTLSTTHDPQRLLDLGCGPGESTFALAECFPDAEVVGIDFAAAMIERAERRHARHHATRNAVRFEVADATALPFDDASFDLVIGHSFLYLVPDRAGVLREAERVLRPNGLMLLMEPAAGVSLASACRRSRDRVRRALRQAPVAALRFGLSMAFWRLWSGSAGRLSPEQLSALYTAAGFRNIRITSTLGGLGLHAAARRARAIDWLRGP